MKYIKRTTEGILVLEKEARYLTKGLKQFMNEACIQNLSTFEGRKQAAQIILNHTSNLPIYVDEDTIMFPTKSIRNYDCIYVNYHQVLSLKETIGGSTRIVFNDLSEIKVDTSIVKMRKQLFRAQTIFKAKNTY